jgi:hypothetical protein
MFLKIFLGSVVLLVLCLVSEAVIFVSVWRNADNQDEVFKRMPYLIVIGVGGALGVLGMVVSGVLRYFGYMS